MLKWYESEPITDFFKRAKFFMYVDLNDFHVLRYVNLII